MEEEEIEEDENGVEDEARIEAIIKAKTSPWLLVALIPMVWEARCTEPITADVTESDESDAPIQDPSVAQRC